MTIVPEEYALASYDYELPEDQIAQIPADKRDGSKLFVLNRATGAMELRRFTELGTYLPEHALIVANNSKVLPARILGSTPTGGKAEFLLLTPLPLLQAERKTEGWLSAAADGLLRGSRRRKPGDLLYFTDDLQVEVVSVGDFGQSKVLLHWRGDIYEIFNAIGKPPLPPYIKREAVATDTGRYQTVFADATKQGSAAAPTAGLHFTPELLASLTAAGHDWAEATLYVGYGTFSPVRAEDIRNHRMHEEFVELSQETADAVIAAKDQDRPVVAVGTTTVRTLEGVYERLGEIAPYRGPINLFLKPGSRFGVVDHMITNFHLPRSSLLIMISAFAGRERVLRAYARALEQGCRFYSYGDAMLIL